MRSLSLCVLALSLPLAACGEEAPERRLGLAAESVRVP